MTARITDPAVIAAVARIVHAATAKGRPVRVRPSMSTLSPVPGAGGQPSSLTCPDQGEPHQPKEVARP